jgi:hypothetical protein
MQQKYEENTAKGEEEDGEPPGSSPTHHHQGKLARPSSPGEARPPLLPHLWPQEAATRIFGEYHARRAPAFMAPQGGYGRRGSPLLLGVMARPWGSSGPAAPPNWRGPAPCRTSGCGLPPGAAKHTSMAIERERKGRRRGAAADDGATQHCQGGGRTRVCSV